MYLWWSLCTLYLYACQVSRSYHRRLVSLLLYLCYVFRALINSLVCWLRVSFVRGFRVRFVRVGVFIQAMTQAPSYCNIRPLPAPVFTDKDTAYIIISHLEFPVLSLRVVGISPSHNDTLLLPLLCAVLFIVCEEPPRYNDTSFALALCDIVHCVWGISPSHSGTLYLCPCFV